APRARLRPRRRRRPAHRRRPRALAAPEARARPSPPAVARDGPRRRLPPLGLMGARAGLARRIALVYVSLILVVTAVLGLYLTLTLRSTQLARLEDKMAAEARLVALAVEPDVRARDAARVNDRARRFADGIGARVTVIA